MVSVRQRRLRSAGALFLATLLFVPVVASGHQHLQHAGVPCATCAVTRHTPAASAPVVTAPVCRLLATTLDVETVTPPAVPVRRGAPPRAPPLSATTAT